VANSFSEWMTKMDVEFTITQPKGYELCEDFTRGAQITYDQKEALMNADFVYVKNWSSYNAYGQMPEVKENWMMDLSKHKLTNNAHIMHCLPVRRDLELSSLLIDHPKSLVQQQAANRIYSSLVVIKSILEKLNKNNDSFIKKEELTYI
jgi:N-succinyl-L-ornithine transcarbamylase